MTVDYKEGGGGVVVPSYLTLVTPWIVAYRAPLFMEFCRPEYWSGLPFPSPGGPPNPGVKARFPVWHVDSVLLSHLGSPF